MKKALLISLAILCSLLAGCGNEDTKYTKHDVDVFDYPYKQRIYVDKETGVQYIYISAGNQCGLSVRLDANGKPMVDRSVRK